MNLKKFIFGDKRKYIRSRTNIPCSIVLGSDIFSSRIIDISNGGARVAILEKIANDKIKLLFYFGEYFFDIDCIIINQTDYDISVQFIEDEKLYKSNLNYVLSLVELGEDII